MDNLHFIWDHLFDMPDQRGGTFQSPLRNEDEWEYMSNFALSIMKEHSISSLSQQLRDHPKPQDWAQVSAFFITSFLQDIGRISVVQEFCLHCQMER